MGPMQLVGGIKGSQVLTFDDIAALAYGFLGENVFNVGSEISMLQYLSVSPTKRYTVQLYT